MEKNVHIANLMYEMYELILEFTEGMDNLLDQLKQKEEKMLKNIIALKDAANIAIAEGTGEDLARQALEGDPPPPDAPTYADGAALAQQALEGDAPTPGEPAVPEETQRYFRGFPIKSDELF